MCCFVSAADTGSGLKAFMGGKMKKKLHNIDFIRSVAAIGIICFHYACGTASEYKFMLTFANGIWGDIFVIIFFVLSGGLLYLNNEVILSPKEFYYKRFKAIFP